ncbi:MAG: hypothetical protein C4542_04375 [Dehalococcoidia bacterium]|nr:MAG: hypothetical protein C4542_04375 [Dehalococcoidia bacterium]
MARSLPYPTIADGDDLVAGPVQANFADLNNRFSTTPGTGIGNGDIASNAAIADTKFVHGNTNMNTFLALQHSATGTHTFSDNGCTGLYLTPDASNPKTKLTVAADALTLENSSGNPYQLTDVSETVNITTGQLENGTLEDTAEAADTYYILVLYDSAAEGTTAALYTRSTLDTTFWETDLVAFNAAVGGGAAYDYAKVVGMVDNVANQAGDGFDFEIPRPIPGGSFYTPYMPTPPIIAVGAYTGDGIATQEVTGTGNFTPDIVIVIGENDSPPWIKITSLMADYYSARFSGGYATTGVRSVDYSSFTVGDADGVNANGVIYDYICIKLEKGILA